MIELKKEHATPIFIYVVTVFMLVAIFYLLFNMFVVADEMINPCDVCMKNNPSMQNCIEDYNKAVYTTPVLNLTGLESFVGSQ